MEVSPGLPMDGADRMKPPTVFVCEAEPAAIAGLRWYLSGNGCFQVAGETRSTAEAAWQIRDTRPDLVIMDHGAGVRSTLSLLSELALEQTPPGCVLWMRDLPESDLVRAYRAGAKGFVRKSSPLPVVLDALRRVLRGETFLEDSASTALRQLTLRRNLPHFTPRERDVIELVSRGMKNREIAEKLTITPGTVKVHLMHIFEKSGARDRYELAVRGARLLMETEPFGEVRRSA